MLDFTPGLVTVCRARRLMRSRSGELQLPGQAIFRPVLNEDYATRLALDWNCASPGQTRHAVAGATVVPGPIPGAPGRRSRHRGVLDPGRGPARAERGHCRHESSPQPPGKP